MAVQAVSPSRETLDFIKETGGETFKMCYQCGLCSGICPWNLARNQKRGKIFGHKIAAGD